VDNAVGIIVGFALTTVAGGWWASYLQQRAWNRQNEVRLLEAALDRAGAACRDITLLLDRRLYRMQRLAWAATRASAETANRDELEDCRQNYVEILFDWNDHLNTNLSLIGTYFGAAARDELDLLYEEFRRVGTEIEALVRAASAGGDITEFGASLLDQFEERSAQSLNDRVYLFGVRLMTQLREGQVGQSAPDRFSMNPS
jgi:hypothetical protein